MAAMNDSTRRLIMMLTIIFAGTAVTFMELSPAVVIVISLFIGIVMLFGLKILSFDELKNDLSSFREKLNQPLSIGKKGEKKTTGKEISHEEKEETGKKREIPFAGILAKFSSNKGKKKENKEGEKKSSLFSGIFAGIGSKDKDEKTKKIDELLDKTINETTEGSDTQDGKKPDIGEEDFSDFDDLDLGLEDDDPDMEDEIGEIGDDIESMPASVASGMEEEIPDSAIAEILAKEGIEFDLESDSEFPEMSDEEDIEADSGTEGDLSDIDELDSDVSGLDLEDDELDEFDKIDLDDIEPDEEIEIEDEDEDAEIEIGVEENEEKEAVITPPDDQQEDLFAAPPKEWSQSSGMTESYDTFEEPVMSFGGGGDEDDLFAMLKSDTQKAVNVQEMSLVRDLKDTPVEGSELIEGLESVLQQMGVQIEKIEGKEESNPDSTVEEKTSD